MAEPTVFIVDDDEAVRDSLAAVLEGAGFAVQTFPSAEAFLDGFEDGCHGCMLVDVRMPGMGGLELQGELTGRGVRLPVVMMTGYGDVPTAVRAMKAGVEDFVEKPVDAADLIATVRRLLEVEAEATREQAAAHEVVLRLARLTPRERDVLEQVVTGAPNKVVAHELGISPRTVEIHRARVMEKMQARNLSELIRMSLATGILDR